MKRRSQIVCLAAATLLANCSHAQHQASAPSGSPASPTAAPQNSSPAAAQLPFSNPTVSPMAVVTVPAVPGLLQPTNAAARVPSIATGRRDPFAAVITGPTSFPIAAANRTGSRQVASASASPLSRLSPIPLSPMPLSPVGGSQPLPLPAAPATALPPIALPAAPAPVSPTTLAEAVEVSGVLQVKGKWQVIVKESNAETSRYVSVGDSLEGGRVVVKKIIADGKSDPIVVLQQNGREVMKSIGTGGSIASR